jgi:hypothetical protein
MIKLGAQVKDKVSGYVGIATSRVEYLNGCVQYGVRGKVDKDNKAPEAVYIDEEQLVVFGKGISIVPKPTGGDMLDRPKR